MMIIKFTLQFRYKLEATVYTKTHSNERDEGLFIDKYTKEITKQNYEL